MVKDLLQIHYQVLSVISEKVFTKLNSKTLIFSFNIKVLKKVQQNINAYFAVRIIQTRMMKNENSDSRTYFKFSANDTYKCILLLRIFVYFYVYMNEWEKSNEKSMLKKDDFYINLNIENIADEDCSDKK